MLDGNALGDQIAALITAPNAPSAEVSRIKSLWESIATAITDHIVANLDVTIPASQVIIAVAGSATGTPNPAPIKNIVQ